MKKDEMTIDAEKLAAEGSKPTNFQLILEFQESLGNLSGPFDPVKILKETMAQITSEYEELKDEVEEIFRLSKQIPFPPENFRYHNLRKEIADLGVVLLQMAARMGFDYDQDFAEVHENNLSKLISTQDQILATLKKYQVLGVDIFVCYTRLKGNSVAIVKSKFDQTGLDGKFYPANKGLKPAGYESVKLSNPPVRKAPCQWQPSGEAVNLLGSPEEFKVSDQ